MPRAQAGHFFARDFLESSGLKVPSMHGIRVSLKKPQLACDFCSGHAICTIANYCFINNLLIYKYLFFVRELAQRLQLSSNPAQ
jgi:hypothetical protein